MRKKILLLTLIVVIGIISIITSVRIVVKIIKEKQKPNKIIYNVSVMKAKASLLKETVTAQAIVEGDPQVKVYPNNISGIFIENRVKEGDYIRKDHVIAEIDRDTPGSDFLPALIKSPISGVITKLYYQNRGAYVSSQQPVAEVADVDNVKIIVNIGEKDLKKVKQNQTVSITSDYSPEIKVNARVNSVTPFIDNDTFSGYITVLINNKEKMLTIGMSVNVEIEIDQRMAIVVPESTVLMGQDNTYVYINNNNTAKLIEVKTGFIKNGFIEIYGDLKDNDEIITTGNFKLYDGAPIKVLK